ncbi:hypothetical protein PIB30_057597 [Stylosanthes scabra]|uniref:Uncharacterized protein n=1 Tax=Stylosanthes scabra TaxID=79078 RepID=A0ABU6VJH7_9FABA|nr:hypothetical protein [Stylosanthes scabra]
MSLKGRNAPSKTGYGWVKEAVWCIPSKFVDAEGVRRLGPLLYGCEMGRILPLSSCRALLRKVFAVKDLMEADKLCPFSNSSQFLGFYEGFRDSDGVSGSEAIVGEFYIKVRSAEDGFPFFLDRHLAEKFPLYWNKRPSQCLGVEELSDRDPGLVEFLFLNLEGGKVLTTSELLKWDNDRESVIDYLESRVPDCNTLSLKSFFKQRVENEVSSSQVVKIEKRE